MAHWKPVRSMKSAAAADRLQVGQVDPVGVERGQPGAAGSRRPPRTGPWSAWASSGACSSVGADAGRQSARPWWLPQPRREVTGQVRRPLGARTAGGQRRGEGERPSPRADTRLTRRVRRTPSREPQTLALLQVRRSPRGGQPDDDVAGRDVVADQPALALVGLDGRAERRQVGLELLVERVLVLQAAHQPAAGAGDLERVERQVLVLGHPDRDRLEVLEERGAAQVAAARPDAALDAGLVARADLAQLDPRRQRCGPGRVREPGSRPARGRRSRRCSGGRRGRWAPRAGRRGRSRGRRASSAGRARGPAA